MTIDTVLTPEATQSAATQGLFLFQLQADLLTVSKQ